MTTSIDIIILFLLIIVNGFFSMAEFALVSSRKIKLKQLASEGKTGAHAALGLMEDQTSFLSSIQIGITLVGICTGAYGGATFSHVLEPFIENIPFIGTYSQAISITGVILVITYFSIVIGELVPKRIGLANPEGIACTIAPVFVLITRIFAPFSYLTSGLTHLLVKIFGISDQKTPDIIEDEIHLLLEEGAESGVIDETEHNMMESVFEFGDRPIDDLMIPRPDIIAIDIDDEPSKNLDIMRNSKHTRYPVYRDTLDSIIGIISIRDLWTYSQSHQTIDLSKVIQEILVVPNQITALDLIHRFRNATSPLAIVVDEYGSVVGLITLHDLLEALVGDLSKVDNEEEIELVTRRHDGSWLVDGRTTPEELYELTGISCIEDSARGFFKTMAGFMLYQTGSIPKEGETIVWDNYSFEIVDMDGHRIDKILITPKEPEIKDSLP
ncbi:hemolysin family protein [Methanospirillum purgamenti]|jgi:putative hemolysin|uniref:Hemolysin family protein n=1 Tax=Methanospirillum hungatei TaxID=2203 RepID=A0A8F5ZF56_METHU|nr:hemolysin family protein [Methanospirillum hungatei]QXO94149.1 hemolysin family protein [Methanospirillum hungatei]